VKFDCTYGWGSVARSPYRGKRCRVVELGSSHHAALVEFEDGHRLVCSVRALRRKRMKREGAAS
jgi:hypothetical protein